MAAFELPVDYPKSGATKAQRAEKKRKKPLGEKKQIARSQQTRQRRASPVAKATKIPRKPHLKRELAIDWKVIENEYIGGILDEKDPETGFPKRRYPSLAELSERYGVGLPTLGYHSKSRRWVERRAVMQGKLESQWDQELLKSRDLLTSEAALTLDKYIEKFRKAVESDILPVQSIADLDRAIKLRVYLDKERAGTGQTAGMDLDELQARHKATKAYAKTLDEAFMGIIQGRTDREKAPPRKPASLTETLEDKRLYVKALNSHEVGPFNEHRGDRF